MDINTVYHMDFRTYLQEIGDDVQNINMIVTDPPYNIGFKYNAYSDKLPDEEYIAMIGALCNLPLAIIQYPIQTAKYITPALGVPTDVMAWCVNSNLPRQMRLISFFGVSANRNAVKQAYKNPNDKRIQARIAAGSDGARLYDWFSDIQLVKNTSRQKGAHPCPVPVQLMERIILMTTREGDLVFDPFMGCGTTAIACLNTNRNYVGCEVDKQYYDACLTRIKNHRK